MPDPDQPRQTERLRALWAVGLVVLVAGAAWLAAIGAESSGFRRAAYDAHAYHLPSIRLIAEQAPDVPWEAFRSATTPGYHALLAGASALTPGHTALRVWGMLFGVGLVAVVGLAAAHGLGGVRTACCVLPLAASAYVTDASVNLLPDNAAWLWVALVIALVFAGPVRGWRLAAVAAVLAMTAFTRQIHVWTAGVVVFAAWADGAQASLRPAWLLEHASQRFKAAVPAALATLPAFAVVVAFVLIWGGLVPELFRDGAVDPMTGSEAVTNTGLSIVTPAATLVVLAMFAPFFAPIWISGVRRGWPKGERRSLPTLVVCGALAGVLLAVVSPTTYDTATGRFGGFWGLAKIGPDVAGRSLAITALASLGGALLALLLGLLDRRTRWLLAVTLLGFWSSHLFAAFAWQRYIEPLVLVLLVLSTAAVHRRWGSPSLAWAGPALLGLAFAALNVQRLGPVPDWDTHQWPEPELAAYYQTESHLKGNQLDAPPAPDPVTPSD